MARADSSAAPSLHAFAARFQPYFVAAAGFSLVLNLLMLVPALFMLQVFDRVLTSRSIETLVMLMVLSVGALLFMAYLDIIRARLLTAAAVSLEKLLGPRVLADMIRRSAAPGASDALHGLRDVNSLRAFLTGPGILSLFDSPWAVIYVLIIFLFHPLLGAVALGGALVMLALGMLNEKLSRQPLEAMQTRVAQGRALRRPEHRQRRSRARARHGGEPGARSGKATAARDLRTSCRPAAPRASSPAPRASCASYCRSRCSRRARGSSSSSPRPRAS